MPNPREAVFDVLKQKQARLDEERRVHRREVTQEQAYENWSEDNKRARRANDRADGRQRQRGEH